MPEPEPSPPRGLDHIEIALFVFGVLAIGFIMLAFGRPLAGESYLPIVALWMVGGLAFIWWFHRHLAGQAKGPRPPQPPQADQPQAPPPARLRRPRRSG